MNELTQEQCETLERAKSREGKTSPYPWEWTDGDNAIWAWGMTVVQSDTRDGALLSKSTDKELIIDAPLLQSLAIAQAAQIDDLTAQNKILQDKVASLTKRLDEYLEDKYEITIIYNGDEEYPWGWSVLDEDGYTVKTGTGHSTEKSARDFAEVFVEEL